MLGIDANHPHHTTTMDDFAIFTNLFNRCSDFHVFIPFGVDAPCHELAAHKKRILYHPEFARAT
jgi:hypothetical protein